MVSRRIIVGDVHGHYDGLMALLEAIAPNQDDDLYFLGDLIDRGPKSSQVVSFVQQGGHPCLLGNHEQMMMEAIPDDTIVELALQSWFHSGGQATLESYGNADLLLEHAQWLKTLPLYLDLGDLWLVHAGVDPQLPIENQSADEFCWIRDDFLGTQKPYFPDKLIIIGHTITFTLPGVKPGYLAQGQGWLGIDTGAYHPRSGWLTAFDVTQQRVYQAQVFEGTTRSLPLAESVTQVDPQQIVLRRSP